jgi:hypothetical protein
VIANDAFDRICNCTSTVCCCGESEANQACRYTALACAMAQRAAHLHMHPYMLTHTHTHTHRNLRYRRFAHIRTVDIDPNPASIATCVIVMNVRLFILCHRPAQIAPWCGIRDPKMQQPGEVGRMSRRPNQAALNRDHVSAAMSHCKVDDACSTRAQASNNPWCSTISIFSSQDVNIMQRSIRPSQKLFNSGSHE